MSGLALAQGLQHNNIPFRLFERDPQLHARKQGYRFRISEEGIDALRQSLSSERFAQLSRCCAHVSTSNGNMPSVHLNARTAENSEALLPKSGSSQIINITGKPWSADRGALREVLSIGLGDCVEFGKEYESYEEVEDGVDVTLKDGSTVRGCLLVGADGSWSKIRRQLLPDYHLADTEGRLIFGKTEITDTFTSQFSSPAMSGMAHIRDKQAGVPCLLEYMRFDHDDENAPDDYVYWVLFFRKDMLRADQDLLRLTDGEISVLVQEVTAEWHPSLRCLFDNFSTSLLRIVTVKPPVPAWDENARVTLLGDAAHTMAPTGAIGATTALRDAGLLLQKVIQHKSDNDIQTGVREYENEMRKYATEALQKTAMGGKLMFDMKPYADLPLIDVAGQ